MEAAVTGPDEIIEALMRKTFTIEHQRFSLRVRLPFLVFGVLALVAGLKGWVDLVFLLIARFTAEPTWPTHFALGMGITLLSTVLGGAFIWSFFIPSRKVVIDGATQEVHAAYQYPFGFRRDDLFALGDMNTPEVVWVSDADKFNGGSWVLRVTLPDGRKFSRGSHPSSLSRQKQQAEAWKAEIMAMRR